MNSGIIRGTAAILVAFAPCALAAEWTISPSVESRVSATDNINLTPGTHDNIFGWSVQPRVVFSRNTEATELSGRLSAGVNRYPGNRQLDSEDATAVLSSKYIAERSQYGLNASFMRDSTLNSELATTGIALARRQRNLLTLAPSWSYSLADRSSVFAQYQYDQARYQSGGGLEDYQNHQGTIGYQYLLSERLVTSLTGSYSGYRTDSHSVISDSYSLGTGLTYRATERLSMGAGIGARQSNTTVTFSGLVCPIDPQFFCDIFGIARVPFTNARKTTDRGLTFNTNADYRWERTAAGFVASRDLNPSGNGLMVKTDRLGLQASHDFTERLAGSAGATYLVSRYLGGLGSKTEYYRLESALGWKLDEWWNLGLSYSYAFQKVQDAPQSATANTVTLSISYNWPKISVSR